MCYNLRGLLSQSPQTGQFNSYQLTGPEAAKAPTLSLNPLKRVNSILTSNTITLPDGKFLIVSIPSNGSIQFLQILVSI